MPVPKIKICGVTREQDVRAVVDSGARAIGLNFVKSSPRYVNSDRALELIQSSNAPKLQGCGVFVNETQDNIARLVETLKLAIVQLHGDEDREYLAKIRAKLGTSVTIWKALRVASKSDLDAMTELEPDGWLIDSKVSGVRGGSGKTFDWSLLAGISRSKPLILSGGLNPGNVAEAVRQVAPDWIDVASGVESAPGIKDASLIQKFVSEAGAVH